MSDGDTYADVERPDGLLDPVRVRPGDLLILQLVDAPSNAQRDAIDKGVRHLLGHLSEKGVEGVGVLILPETISVKVLSETAMAELGWVRPPGWNP